MMLLNSGVIGFDMSDDIRIEMAVMLGMTGKALVTLAQYGEHMPPSFDEVSRLALTCPRHL